MIKLSILILILKLKFVPECFMTHMTQEMCDKAVNRCFFVFHSIPDQYKTQEMCGSCF